MVKMNSEAYYDILGGKYVESYKSLGMKKISENEINFVLKNIPKKPKINILEIGVGPGRISREVAEMDVNFFGIDISKKMVNECRKNIKKLKSVKIFQHDASKKLPFKDETFDVVYSIRVLKYVDNFDEVLSEINRTLKRNGILIFSIPNKNSLNIFNIFSKVSYTRVTLKQLLKIIEKKGFYIIEIKGGPKFPDLLYKINNKLLLNLILIFERFIDFFFKTLGSRIFFISIKKIR